MANEPGRNPEQNQKDEGQGAPGRNPQNDRDLGNREPGDAADQADREVQNLNQDVE